MNHDRQCSLLALRRVKWFILAVFGESAHFCKQKSRSFFLWIILAFDTGNKMNVLMQIRRDLAAENLTDYLIILYTQGNQKLQCDISNFPKKLPGWHLFYQRDIWWARKKKKPSILDDSEEKKTKRFSKWSNSIRLRVKVVDVGFFWILTCQKDKLWVDISCVHWVVQRYIKNCVL